MNLGVTKETHIDEESVCESSDVCGLMQLA